MYDRNALIALVRERALQFGDFTLASGKKAKYYLDGKQVTLDSFGVPGKATPEGVKESWRKVWVRVLVPELDVNELAIAYVIPRR